MNANDVEARVRNVLADVLALDAENIDGSTSKETVEAWNSLNNLTVIMALEEEFGLSFADSEMDAMLDFPTVVTAIHRKIGRHEP